MQKIRWILLFLGIAFGGSWLVNCAMAGSGVLLPSEIYVFVQKTCPHCQAAEAYLDKSYSNVSIQIRDISQSENRALFFACAEKFGLSKWSLGTPLFCIGNHYIMGWGPEEQAKFDAYVKDFFK